MMPDAEDPIRRTAPISMLNVLSTEDLRKAFGDIPIRIRAEDTQRAARMSAASWPQPQLVSVRPEPDHTLH
jgi:hypothetical protein